MPARRPWPARRLDLPTIARPRPPSPTRAALLGPLIITQLAARAKAALPPGASRVHIYDQPLAVLAALLACGLLLGEGCTGW